MQNCGVIRDMIETVRTQWVDIWQYHSTVDYTSLTGVRHRQKATSMTIATFFTFLQIKLAFILIRGRIADSSQHSYSIYDVGSDLY
jgi:hypothetical protein